MPSAPLDSRVPLDILAQAVREVPLDYSKLIFKNAISSALVRTFVVGKVLAPNRRAVPFTLQHGAVRRQPNHGRS
jgi:hypothetical protein